MIDVHCLVHKNSPYRGWEKKHYKEGTKDCPDRGPVQPATCGKCRSRRGCPARP